MWGINNPIKVYDYLPEAINKFTNLLLPIDKYVTFPEEDRRRIEQLVNENFTINDVSIKDPNNPANLIKAKLLSYNLATE